MREPAKAAWERAARHEDVLVAVARFAGNAAFPRLAYRLRWPTRLTDSRLVAYIAMNGLFGFCFRHFALPYFRRNAEAIAKLKAELGRDPTQEEVAAALGLGRP